MEIGQGFVFAICHRYVMRSNKVIHNCHVNTSHSLLYFCRVYCTPCIRKFVGDDEVQLVLDTNPWHCYLCSPVKCSIKCLLEARLDWRENIVKLLGPPDAITVCCIILLDVFRLNPILYILFLFKLLIKKPQFFVLYLSRNEAK